MQNVFSRAGKAFAFFVNARIWIEHLVGQLGAEFIFCERRAQPRIISGPPPRECVLPAVNNLSSGSPFAIYDPRPGCDGAASPRRARFVEGLPLETLADAEADLMERGDQGIIAVG